jgi:hypothetical protein
MKQSSLEISGRLVVKFIALREILLKFNELSMLEKIYNPDSDLLKLIRPRKVSVLATLLGLHSKLIYEKGQFNSNNDYFEEIISIFQMENLVFNNNSDFSSMIEESLNTLRKF